MNQVRLSLIAVATLALAACAGKQPGDTIINMQKEICRTGDPMAMQAFVSKKSQPAVAMLGAVMAEPEKAEQLKTEIKAQCEAGGDVEILETKIDGDKATVRYHDTDGEERTETLIKEDGEWKLDMQANK